MTADEKRPQAVIKAAIEAAACASYEYEGDRRGVSYVGWDAEPEVVREEWRACVRVPILVYEEMTEGSIP